MKVVVVEHAVVAMDMIVVVVVVAMDAVVSMVTSARDIDTIHLGERLVTEE